jgi:translation elongation factor aEF-1 beta
MAKIVITYKIFPTDINVDFEKLKRKIEESLPKNVTIYGYGMEPIAFGLNALLAQISLPEEETGLVDELEKNLQEIEEISQIQTVTVSRTR